MDCWPIECSAQERTSDGLNGLLANRMHCSGQAFIASIDKLRKYRNYTTTIHAAKKYRCRVTGITLSVELAIVAEKSVKAEGLECLIQFEVVDYRTFARRAENGGKFDCDLSCEMIKALLGYLPGTGARWYPRKGSHYHSGATLRDLSAFDGLHQHNNLPRSCCPSLHAWVDAAYRQPCLTLEHVDSSWPPLRADICQVAEAFRCQRVFRSAVGIGRRLSSGLELLFDLLGSWLLLSDSKLRHYGRLRASQVVTFLLYPNSVQQCRPFVHRVTRHSQLPGRPSLCEAIILYCHSQPII